MNTAYWFFMMTGEPDIPTDIAALARAHSKAAIEALVEIMTQADAPAGVRVTAARALLARGWGAAVMRQTKEESRAAPVKHTTKVIVDSKPPDQQREPESRSDHSAPHRYSRPARAAARAFPDRQPGEDMRLAQRPPDQPPWAGQRFIGPFANGRTSRGVHPLGP